MIKEIAEKLDFPAEAAEYFEECLKKILATPDMPDALHNAMDDYFAGDGKAHPEILKEIAEKSEIHPHATDMVFLLFCARPLRYIYIQKGIDEEIFWDSMSDLRCKLMECKNIYGHWGLFVGWWYRDFYLCQRFKLGRLEYERVEFPLDDYKGIVSKGDIIYNCHIPSCGPVTVDSVIDSLKKAYAFYRDELKNGIMPVYCSSWMLYSKHLELYPENSNLRRFYDLFDIINEQENPNNHNFWRIFNVEYSAETLDDAPENTTLQRNFKKYLKAGNTMGTGKGMLLFDGEKIIN